jgi:hypothetical protein
LKPIEQATEQPNNQNSNNRGSVEDLLKTTEFVVHALLLKVIRYSTYFYQKAVNQASLEFPIDWSDEVQSLEELLVHIKIAILNLLRK